MPKGRDPGEKRFVSREKRRFRRLLVSSAATLIGADEGDEVSSWVRNISVGGALLSSQYAPPGHRSFRLQLHLPWIEPLTVVSRPVHWQGSGRGPAGLGLEFLGLQRSSQLALEQVLTSAEYCLQRGRSTVLAVTESLLTRSSLEKDFYLLERPVIIVDSIHSAFHWFHDWEARIEAVLVDLELQQVDPIALLRHFGQTYPQVRRIAVIDSRQHDLWLSAARVGLADRILFDPWEHLELDAALDG